MGWRAATREDGVHRSSRRLEILEHPAGSPLLKRILDEPSRQNCKSRSGEHSIDERLLIVCAKPRGDANRHSLAMIVKFPFVRALIVREMQAVMIGELSGVLRNPMAREILR